MRITRIMAVAAALSLGAGCGSDSSAADSTTNGAVNVRVEPDLGPKDMAAADGDLTDTSADAPVDAAPELPDAECASDIDCSDGVFCNGVERCFEGVCFDSPTPQCADRSDCTTDVCDEEAERCDYVPDDSQCAPGQFCRSKGGCFTPSQCAVDADCDDGLLCNGTERCVVDTCEPGDPVECGDGIACTEDTCVEGTGACQSVSNHANCLPTELCVVGVGCSPRPPCTRDDDCDDGVFCNGRERCVDDVCQPGQPQVVVDAVDCTIDQCNESLNMVVNTPDHARCADGVYCNGAEICHPHQWLRVGRATRDLRWCRVHDGHL